MKVLVFCPKLTLNGGVANFYRMLKPQLSGEFHIVEKSQFNSLVGKLFGTLIDQIRLFCLLCFGGFDTVLLNPSLGSTAMKRDSVNAFIAKRVLKKRTFIFWHGWNLECAKSVEDNYLPLFQRTFFKADKMFVLATSFGNTLKEWGYQKPVTIMTTCYEEFEVAGTKSINTPVKVLFLSRVEIAKGILIVLDAFALINKQAPNQATLYIAGDGDALTQVKDYVAKQQIDNVIFTGYVRGEEKNNLLNSSDIFFMPSYSEGLPCAMLEAMGAGLPIITRNVGGIPDVLTPAMGYMSDSVNPADFAKAILELIEDKERLLTVSNYNKTYAKEHFTAAFVAEKIKTEISL